MSESKLITSPQAVSVFLAMLAGTIRELDRRHPPMRLHRTLLEVFDRHLATFGPEVPKHDETLWGHLQILRSLLEKMGDDPNLTFLDDPPSGPPN